MNLTYEEIARVTGGTLLVGDAAARPERVITDTRALLPGDCFLALRGKRFDGHAFIGEAFAKGATGVVLSDSSAASALRRRFADLAQTRSLVTSSPARQRTVLQVADTAKALSDIASFHRRRFRVPVVAVTGSNGKTTCKDMLAKILASKLRVVKTAGTQNNQIGVPLTLLRLRASHQVAVLELGMNHKGEIAALASIAHPTVAVITNAGPAHLEFLKSVPDVARAKGELLRACAPGATAVLNLDDPHFPLWKKLARGRVVTFGLHPKAQVRGDEIRVSPDALPEFMLIIGRRRVPVRLSVPGLHHVSLALAAAAAATALKIAPEPIAAALMEFRPEAPMRMAVSSAGGIRYLNDAYNANPASLEAALRTAFAIRQKRNSRRVLLLGEMAELGRSSKALHAAVGQTLSKLSVATEAHTVVLAVGGSDADALARAAGQGKRAVARAFPRLDEACDFAAKLLRSGDLVLIKGSRATGMERALELLPRAVAASGRKG